MAKFQLGGGSYTENRGHVTRTHPSKRQRVDRTLPTKRGNRWAVREIDKQRRVIQLKKGTRQWDRRLSEESADVCDYWRVDTCRVHPRNFFIFALLEAS